MYTTWWYDFLWLLVYLVQDGQTALVSASKEGHDQIVELLLRRDANVNHQTKVRLLMFSMCILHMIVYPCVGRLKKPYTL